MSTHIKNQQPNHHSTLRRLLTRHPVAAFMVMAFDLSLNF